MTAIIIYAIVSALTQCLVAIVAQISECIKQVE